MRKWGRPLLLVALLGSPVIGFATLPPSAAADTRVVNCGAGRRIGVALRLPAGRQLTIVVSGTCNENIVIDKDNVTLTTTTGAAITGPDPAVNTIHVNGAKNVVINGLTVSGARNGVLVENGANLAITGATITNNAQSGVVALGGSTVTIDASHVTSNGTGGQAALGQHGITIVDRSAAFITNSTVANNVRNGVFVGRSSTARLGRSRTAVAGPNTISGNGGSGVAVFQASYAWIDGNTITGNRTGVDAELSSSAVITLNEIAANTAVGVLVSNGSAARIGLDEGNGDPRRPDGFTNWIHDNGSDGIQVNNGSHATMRGNLVKLNRRRGLSVNKSTAHLVGDNLIDSNVADGVAAFPGSAVQQARGDFTFATAHDRIVSNGTGGDPNASWGVIIFDGSAGRFDDVEITGSRSDGILVGIASSLDFRGATVSGSGGSGILVVRGASADVRSSTINGNTGNGIGLSTGGSANVRDTSVRQNGGAGIGLSIGSSAQISRTTGTSEITLNARDGVFVGDGSSASISDTAITGNTGVGIRADSNSFVRVSRATGTSEIRSNTGGGVNLHLRSTGFIADTTIDSNGALGIVVNVGSALKIVNTTVTGRTHVTNHSDTGIRVWVNSQLELYRG